MGWLFSNRWESQKQVEEHLIGQIKQAGYKALDKSSSWGEFYVLCENQDGERDIFVALIKGSKPTNRKSGEFGYKDMSESCGPCYYNCPERLLSKSTCQHEHAIAWREKCRKVREEKNLQLKMLKGLKAGDKIMSVFGELIFGYHHKTTQFVATNVQKATQYRYNARHIKLS